MVIDGGTRRSPEEHAFTLARLERLLHHRGGIYFGADLVQQLAIASPSAQRRSQMLTTLRFCCAPWAFAFIREGLQRYPIEHTRFSKPQPGDSWWHHPKAPHVFEPGRFSDSHPYPVELDLPPWTVSADIDLRSWLFAFGGGIRIESPDVRKTIDGIIATACIEANLPLLFSDRDFQPYVEHLGLVAA